VGVKTTKARQVIALAAETVREPGTDAGLARHLAAGHDKGAGRIVIDGAGVDGAHERDVIDDLRRVRQQLAGPHAALAVLRNLKHRRRDGQPRLAAGHGGDALALAHALRQILVKKGLQARLVIPQIELRGRAVHVQVDEAFRLRGKVRQPRQRRMHGLGHHVSTKHGCQGDITRPQADVSEKLAACLLLVEL
jgi:hypothetical protein